MNRPATTDVTPVPQPLAPIAGARVDPATVHFLWRDVPDAASYTFQLATDEAFTNLVLTSETDAVRRTLAGLQSDAVYYWRVQAQGAGKKDAYSKPAMFRTHAVAKGPTANVPAPLSPVGGIPADAAAVALRWTSVPRASAYQVHVSTGVDFSALAFDVVLGNTTSLTLFSLLPEDGTTYYWRVRGKTDNGWQPWSTPVSFHAVDDLHADAFDADLQETRAEANRLDAQWREAHAGNLAETEAPYLKGRTSLAATLSFALVMILSFLGLIWVLRIAVL